MKSDWILWDPLAIDLNSTPSRSMSCGKHHSTILPVQKGGKQNINMDPGQDQGHKITHMCLSTSELLKAEPPLSDIINCTKGGYL